MMLVNSSIAEFSDALASSEAVPGGGGVSALAGALGAGLGIMVGCLTVGKKKYAQTEPEMRALMRRADELKARLLALIEDAAAAPLEIVRLSCEAIALMEGFAANGSVLAVSDAGCGAALCRAALEAAALNVFVNTRLMKDRSRADEMNNYVNGCLGTYLPQAEQTYNAVRRRLV